jgi:hypothetical protein
MHFVKEGRQKAEKSSDLRSFTVVLLRVKNLVFF